MPRFEETSTVSEPLFYEDVPVPMHYETGGIVVTETHIVQFAGIAGDFADHHMDDRAAQSAGFPRRIAHGLLCLALIDGLKNRAVRQFAAIASLKWDYSFRAPVFAGDRLSARIAVIGKRPTSRGDRGILTLRFEAVNQDDQIVQDGTNLLMVRARAVGK
jgi:acyl dehydratase